MTRHHQHSHSLTLIFSSSLGLIWSEIKQLWDTGAKEYVSDMWNVADFVTNALYLATIALRLRAYYDVSLLGDSQSIHYSYSLLVCPEQINTIYNCDTL